MAKPKSTGQIIRTPRKLRDSMQEWQLYSFGEFGIVSWVNSIDADNPFKNFSLQYPDDDDEYRFQGQDIGYQTIFKLDGWDSYSEDQHEPVDVIGIMQLDVPIERQVAYCAANPKELLYMALLTRGIREGGDPEGDLRTQSFTVKVKPIYTEFDHLELTYEMVTDKWEDGVDLGAGVEISAVGPTTSDTWQTYYAQDDEDYNLYAPVESERKDVYCFTMDPWKREEPVLIDNEDGPVPEEGEEEEEPPPEEPPPEGGDPETPTPVPDELPTKCYGFLFQVTDPDPTDAHYEESASIPPWVNCDHIRMFVEPLELRLRTPTRRGKSFQVAKVYTDWFQYFSSHWTIFQFTKEHGITLNLLDRGQFALGFTPNEFRWPGAIQLERPGYYWAAYVANVWGSYSNYVRTLWWRIPGPTYETDPILEIVDEDMLPYCLMVEGIHQAYRDEDHYNEEAGQWRDVNGVVTLFA